MKMRLFALIFLGTGLATWVMAEGAGDGEGDKRGERRRELMKRMEERGELRGGGMAGAGAMAGIPGMPGGMEGGMIAKLLQNEKLVKELGLTEDQIGTLKKGLEEQETAISKLRGELEQGGLNQAKLLTQPTVDETGVMDAIEKTGKIRTEMAKLLVKQLLLVKKTLTPEQVEQIKEMRERLRKERQEKMAEGAGKKGADGEGKWKKAGDGEGKGDAKGRGADKWEMRKKHTEEKGGATDKPGMENFKEW